MPINRDSALEVINQIDAALTLLRPLRDVRMAFGDSWDEANKVIDGLLAAQQTVAKAGIGVDR
ncbi:MAG TPA: hypothetical protein VGN19_05695 [Pedococcus sp.]|nr:hypothetical protein [Pedococcus sp.]